ncbi:MAG: TRAP transporter fused permease subunit [Pseudomonadota bacterium]|nr:TRAP transporter fused permease subunit [Pseudomonadota bacterium]
MTEQNHRLIWVGLGIASIGFHIWLIFSGLVPSLVSRPLHMALALPWVFIFASEGAWQRRIGLLLTAAGALFCGYIALNESSLSDQYGFISGGWQITVGIGLILLTLEMARRAVSWPLPLITLLFLLYGLFGSHIPGEFGHPGLPFNSFLGTLVITEGGLWGKLTGVSVSVVAVFVIFGAVLNAGEAGQGFMNIAIAAAGRLKGGAAKVSVLSSALFGSISGSASANVASTGMVTLPSMRRLGYPKRIAAAVEAVASTGGQIMPPLMGAGAFVMVELTGIPYTQIILAAALPAILYFATVWFGVNGYADRHDLKPYAKDMRPALRAVITTSLFFAVPFAALLIVMFSGYTPQFAAACAIILAALLLLTGADLTFDSARARERMMQAATTAGRQIAMIASIILCASIIVGILGMTGLGVKITSGILAFSGDNLWLALALTALACIILGMEVPTTAAYVICVSVAGPALIDMGVAPLLVHLFIFWYALLSTITPPVCGGVFIAASMVEENWLRVAGSAMSLGLGLYVIPLAIIRHPELTDLASAPLIAVLTALQIGIGLALLGRGLIAPHGPAIRVGFGAAGLAVIFLRFTG